LTHSGSIGDIQETTVTYAAAPTGCIPLGETVKPAILATYVSHFKVTGGSFSPGQ